MREWGVDMSVEQPGGLSPQGPQPHASPREVYLLQRKQSKVGDGLGKTTGWIHRASLQMKKVKMLSGVSYQKIDDAGLQQAGKSHHHHHGSGGTPAAASTPASSSSSTNDGDADDGSKLNAVA